MLFNQDSFKSYDGILMDTLDFENFKPGTYGLTLAQLKEIDGLGAKVISQLATLMQVPEDVMLIKYGMNAEMQTTFCMYPSWRCIEENEQSDLYFVMGDFKATLTSVYEAVSAHFNFAPEILTVGNEQDKREIAAFTFTKADVSFVRDSDKYSFVIKPNRAIEDAAAQIVDVFSASKGMEDLYNSLIGSGLVSGLGEEMNFCRLKELPFGGYEISNLYWEDKTVEAKKGKNAGSEVRIANWRFRAKSMLDGTVYGVDASKSSFIGKAIASNNAILAVAGKDAGGDAYIYIDGHRELAQGISVEGRVFTNPTTAQKYLAAQQQRAAISASQAVKAQLTPAPTVTVPATTVKPVTVATPTVDTDGTAEGFDLPF